MITAPAEKSESANSKAECPKEPKDLYARFKEVTQVLKTTLYPISSLLQERNQLAYGLYQDKEFMNTLKIHDSQDVKNIERLAKDHSLSHSHFLENDKGGFSL
jgi:hypothetical protein